MEKKITLTVEDIKVAMSFLEKVSTSNLQESTNLVFLAKRFNEFIIQNDNGTNNN